MVVLERSKVSSVESTKKKLNYIISQQHETCFSK